MLDTYRKIIDLLNRRERMQFCGLVLLSFIMGLFDVITVASIFPFLAVVANPDIVQHNAVLRFIYGMLGFTTSNGFLLFLGCAVFLTVVCGIAFRAMTFYALTRFTRMRGLSLATRLLSKYLAQPYAWFLDRHTAQLGRKVLGEVIEVVNGPITASMRLMANMVVVVLLIGLLVLLQPLAALIAAMLVSGCYGLIFLVIRRRLNALGEVRLDANRERYRIMQEALGGIKEVKILNLEMSYIGRFHEPAKLLANSQSAMTVISELPRHILEGVTFGGMLLFVIWLLFSGDSGIEGVIPVLGVFAFAGARLFPTIQQVYAGFAVIRFGQPALASLHADLLEPWADEPIDFSQMAAIPLRRRLELADVTFAYPGSDRQALHGMSATIDAKTTVAMVGSTGAGKTTAIDVILGLLQPESGALLVDGKVIDAANVGAWRKSVGYVPQTIFLVDDTVAANIAFGVGDREIDMVAVERAAAIAQLSEFVADQPDGYHTIIGERGARLSGGQRQRIGIARALYRDPDILIFDEATSALDNLTERAVMDAVTALGHKKTIILIAHRLSTVRHCDAIFFLENGRVIASGAYDELVQENQHFRALHEAGL